MHMPAGRGTVPAQPRPHQNGHNQPAFYSNSSFAQDNNQHPPPPAFLRFDEGVKARTRDPAHINGKHGKAPTSDQGGAAHQDALMELARENLLLKHQLHVASAEATRLKELVDKYNQVKEEKKESVKQAQSRYWSEDEHQLFLVAIQTFGHKDVKSIASVVGTRSATQVRTHAQKYFMKLARSRTSEEGQTKGSNPDQDPSEAVRAPPLARRPCATTSVAVMLWLVVARFGPCLC